MFSTLSLVAGEVVLLDVLRRQSDFSMKIVMVSDTHGKHPALPAGDVLVHCGDLTHFGSFAELRAEVEWLKSLVFRYVILIGGNHDIALGNLCDKKAGGSDSQVALRPYSLPTRFWRDDRRSSILGDAVDSALRRRFQSPGR
jgi:hypothetical protein